MIAVQSLRPELLVDGRLLVADAHRDLLVVDPDDGAVDERVTTVDGKPMVFCNNAAVARNGDIWFSDSSMQHAAVDRSSPTAIGWFGDFT
ncbi:MAG TPA: hypothetical protein PK331_10260 [Gordonia sp. (in: high G+C Gram-positive bacteria)]|uniref:hypothetical protein n=1 Tax=unclassified Gordonia (in: high G+C Gram-positive bacteria) TaxID=2657482 RepID=UPI0025B96653|nr:MULTISPECIES: hypothetical protein [unclassified Gordonia (in: high G+C Gram-positive bacteria)]HNP57827.1 hypothetical protein [Gordonia sp. (in: high G+C Gram-positive bacteria)]HRC51286.1 hypothetical protein [Gordonia sp. (in: high G+C Gram-positive bacteria)]